MEYRRRSRRESSPPPNHLSFHGLKYYADHNYEKAYDLNHSRRESLTPSRRYEPPSPPPSPVVSLRRKFKLEKGCEFSSHESMYYTDSDHTKRDGVSPLKSSHYHLHEKKSPLLVRRTHRPSLPNQQGKLSQARKHRCDEPAWEIPPPPDHERERQRQHLLFQKVTHSPPVASPKFGCDDFHNINQCNLQGDVSNREQHQHHNLQEGIVKHSTTAMTEPLMLRSSMESHKVVVTSTATIVDSSKSQTEENIEKCIQTKPTPPPPPLPPPFVTSLPTKKKNEQEAIAADGCYGVGNRVMTIVDVVQSPNFATCVLPLLSSLLSLGLCFPCFFSSTCIYV